MVRNFAVASGRQVSSSLPLKPLVDDLALGVGRIAGYRAGSFEREAAGKDWRSCFRQKSIEPGGWRSSSSFCRLVKCHNRTRYSHKAFNT